MSTNAELTVYLGPEVKARWLALCQQRGQKPGAALRQAVLTELEREVPVSMPEHKGKLNRQRIDQPDEGEKVRLELRVTPSELSAVEAAAKSEDCSKQFWIICAMRGALSHEPQFTLEAAKAVWDSNAQLLAIGRNLNQIAKALNAGGLGTITTQRIEEVRDLIKNHTSAVSKLSNASIQRWILQ